MECEKLSLLKHLAVQEPDVLRSEPWKQHVTSCDQCRDTWRGFATSLAVYKHLEHQEASRCIAKPSWDAFCRALRAQKSERPHLGALRGPWLAGAMGLALVGGVISWGLGNDSGTRPSGAIVIDEKALRGSYAAAIPPRSRAIVVREVQAAFPTERQGPFAGDWRSFRQGRMLEPHLLSFGVPSRESAILPFGHERQPIPYVMPVSNAPQSVWRDSSSSGRPRRGGYLIPPLIH